METKVFIASDHGNKKGLHHLVKVLPMYSDEENGVKRNTLDTDTSGGTSDDTGDGIDTSQSKLDTQTNRIKLTGQHVDAGGGGTGASLTEELQIRDRMYRVQEYLPSTCGNHGTNLTLTPPTIQYFGTGWLDKRNVLQFLHSVWN